MHHRRSTVSLVAFLVLAITISALLVNRSPIAGAAEERFQPFQFYAELDVITYGNASIDLQIPRNRVAVIEWISFHAQNVQCKLVGVILRTTLKELGATHTVVGVSDLGPSGVGRSFGLSQKIRA